MKENKERGNPVWNCPFLCFYFTLPSVLYYHGRAWKGCYVLFVFSIDCLNLLLHLFHIIFEFLNATVHLINKAIALL